MVPYARAGSRKGAGKEADRHTKGPGRAGLGAGKERGALPPAPRGRGCRRAVRPLRLPICPSVSLATACRWDSWIPLRGQAPARANPLTPERQPVGATSRSCCFRRGRPAPVSAWGGGWGLAHPLVVAVQAWSGRPGRDGTISTRTPASQRALSRLAPSAEGQWPQRTRGPSLLRPRPARPTLIWFRGSLSSLSCPETLCASGQEPSGWGSAYGRGLREGARGLGGKVSRLADEAHRKGARLPLNAAVLANVAASVTVGTSREQSHT